MPRRWRCGASTRSEPSRLVLVWGIEDGQPLPAAELALDDAEAHTSRCLRERRELQVEAGAEAQALPLLSLTAPRRSALFMPLIAGDDALGVLSIQSPRADAYGDRERQVLRSLAAATAVALANGAQAEQLARVQRELEHQRMQGLLVHAGKMVAVGRLASGVVHEMSHPVGTLLLLAEALAETPARRATTRCAADAARPAVGETERLQQFVGRLRDFARAEPPAARRARPAHACSPTRASCSRRAWRSIGSPTTKSVPALDGARSTPQRLALAVANLVFNAADAMAGGATSAIRDHAVAARRRRGAARRRQRPGPAPRPCAHGCSSRSSPPSPKARASASASR